MPRNYSVKALLFPLSSPDVARITSTLKSSLQRTFEALPVLSGTVQRRTVHNKQSQSLCVGSPWNGIDDVFRAKDLTSSDLDYESLRRNHFPMIPLMQYDLFSVLTSRPDFMGLEHPVMMAQINFVRNGMILAQCLHHSFTDGLGGVTVMGLWATFCRGEDGAKMVSSEMMDRERLMSGDENARLEHFREYVDGSKTSSDTDPGDSSSTPSSAPQPPKDMETGIFFFPRSKLVGLKSVVSTSLASAVTSSSDSKTPSYISTNDALSALIFACITEARKPSNLMDPQQMIPFGLSVSGRRFLNPPLPQNYVGNIIFVCHLDLPLGDVSPEPHRMAIIAQQIRNRLLQFDESHVKRLIGAMHAMDDISKVKIACRASNEWPFAIMHWTGQRYYNMDWGRDIGVCERVRVPKLLSPHFDGAVGVLPELKVEKGTDGEETAGLEVLVSLEKEAMRRLRGMEEWTRWAQWRCS